MFCYNWQHTKNIFRLLKFRKFILHTKLWLKARSRKKISSIFAWTEGINCYLFIRMWLLKISGFVLFSELFRLREHGLNVAVSGMERSGRKYYIRKNSFWSFNKPFTKVTNLQFGQAMSSIHSSGQTAPTVFGPSW